MERDHNARVSLAWQIAALSRSKKLPKLDKLLYRPRKKATQTWQEQYAIMERWAAVQNSRIK